MLTWLKATAYRHFFRRLGVMAKHDTQDIGVITYIVASKNQAQRLNGQGRQPATGGTNGADGQTSVRGERCLRTSRNLLLQRAHRRVIIGPKRKGWSNVRHPGGKLRVLFAVNSEVQSDPGSGGVERW